MNKVNRWKKIFTPTDEKVQVTVGGRLAELTRTQSYRYNELSGSFTLQRRTLAESARRRKQTEASLFAAAGDGHLVLYVNCTGLSGTWRLEQPAGQSQRTKPLTLKSGYLALPAAVCSKLSQQSSAIITVVEFKPSTEPEVLDLDPGQLAELTAQDAVRRYFCLSQPMTVRPDSVYLIEASGEVR